MHNANMFGQQGMDRSPRTLTLWPVRAVCTQREPTGRVIIVIVTERREREDKRGKRERVKRGEERKRERKKDRQRERKTEKAENPSVCLVQNAFVCAFKTPPCVHGKRPHDKPHYTTRNNTTQHTHTPQHTSHAHNHVNTHTHAPNAQSTTDRDLETKSECLGMCTNAPPTMFLHLIKTCNICNVCNFMRTLLFLQKLIL